MRKTGLVVAIVLLLAACDRSYGRLPQGGIAALDGTYRGEASLALGRTNCPREVPYAMTVRNGMVYGEVFTGRPRPGAIIAYLTRAPTDATPLTDGELLPALGGLVVVHTPGHTPGSICLYSPARRFVIVGDILQYLRGRVTYPNEVFTDDMRQARQSIARLAELDIEMILFSHYPALRDGCREALRGLAS